jgi:transposase
VKPDVRRPKNDAADATGIREAVTRDSMRFVGARKLENQAALMHHKVHATPVSKRKKLINASRGHPAEIDVIAAERRKNSGELVDLITTEGNETPPACVRGALPNPGNSCDTNY